LSHHDAPGPAIRRRTPFGHTGFSDTRVEHLGVAGPQGSELDVEHRALVSADQA
jgi:hypothetical protein